MRRAVTTCIAGLAVVLLVLLVGTGTAAAQTCLIDLGGTTGTVHFDGLAPGDSRAWWTSIRNDSDEPVELELQLRGSGVLSEVLDVAVDGCHSPWVGSAGGTITCSGAQDVLHAAAPVDPDNGPAIVELGTLAAGEVLHTRTTATMRSSAGNAYQGEAGDVVTAFAAQGSGSACTEPPVEPPGPPDTGSPDTAPPDTGSPDTAPPTDSGAPRGGPAEPARPRPRGPLAMTGAQLGALALGSVGTVATGLVLARNHPVRRRGQGPPTAR